MATIVRLNSNNYRVQIRKKNLKYISATFPTKKQAVEYRDLIEIQISSIFEAEKSKFPIDMATLFSGLHKDLKDAVRHLPTFMRVMGKIASKDLTLSNLIEDFIFNYKKKDKNIISRLQWWSDNYGNILLDDISEDHIRHGIHVDHPGNLIL